MERAKKPLLLAIILGILVLAALVILIGLSFRNSKKQDFSKSCNFKFV